MGFCGEQVDEAARVVVVVGVGVGVDVVVERRQFVSGTIEDN